MGREIDCWQCQSLKFFELGGTMGNEFGFQLVYLLPDIDLLNIMTWRSNAHILKNHVFSGLFGPYSFVNF